MIKTVSVILFSVFLCAVVSNPVGNSTNTGLAEKGSNLLNGFIGDLKKLVIGMMGDLREAVQTFPANYSNSAITTNDVNGTVIQTNTTIIKKTMNNHVKFHYRRQHKILNPEKNSTTGNSTSVTAI